MIKLEEKDAEYILEAFEHLISNIGEKTTEYHWREFAMCAKILQDAGTTNTYMEKLRCYLNANASDLKYAAYFTSSQYEDPNPTEEEVIDDSNIYNGL